MLNDRQQRIHAKTPTDQFASDSMPDWGITGLPPR
jgi:hypothetical protein